MAPLRYRRHRFPPEIIQHAIRLYLPLVEFFKRFDGSVTPVAATAAFPHNHNPNRDEGPVMVNGKPEPYAEQLFFAGLASLSDLPATGADKMAAAGCVGGYNYGWYG